MSQNLQEIFARVEKAKSRQKEIKTIYRDALASTPEYEEINDKLKALRERKKQIENTIKENFGSEITELEDLKVDIDSDMEMMSDLALTQLIKGETIALKDEHETEYEPVFAVRFRKMK
ncbi:MAG: hypothetical protein KAZ30_00795 [Candidatus Magasanikbacteria bacterium]|nr:hypothetical protein [Candidatus Magasanikbacteria bacterium]